ncbi:MAG: NupC/NupG family nucleoside CNT transporter [Gammaproteobacteria bacterium]
MPPFLQSALGVFVFIALAWVVSEERRAFPWRIVLAGLALQFALAAALLKLPGVRGWALGLNEAMLGLERATEAGTAFVFGYLGGGPLPFPEASPGTSFVLAFRALPLILVVSALSSLLFYWRVLPFIVRGLSRVLEKTLGIGGAVGLSAAADVLVGMVEAPLLVRPYLGALTRGELFSIMSCGMATIAGTVMVLYASILGEVVPEAMGHILTASLINTPGALLIAAVMVPSLGPATAGELEPAETARSSIDAITSGTLAGIALLINIVALLVVFVALVSLADGILHILPDIGGEPVTLRRLLGTLMAPLVWFAGIPWGEAQTAGALMGTKTVLNELVAYLDLARLPKDALSERSTVIMTYALCGFANLGSLGILIGGLGTMVPERRAEVIALGPKSIVSGTLTTLLTGAIVGVLWS